MSNSYFDFKHFSINQDKTAMKVGTDGVILGAWFKLLNSKKILDIGTGTGLLALMLAQNSLASIVAIEPEINAYKQAVCNIENSKWSKNITVENITFQSYIKSTLCKFDLIVCNPPYFEKSLKSKSNSRNIARHNDSLPLDVLISGISKILNNTGSFGIIYPYKDRKKVEFIASQNKLYCKSKLIIKHNSQKEAKRIIFEFTKNKVKYIKKELYIMELGSNEYTNDFINLTKKFYLGYS